MADQLSTATDKAPADMAVYGWDITPEYDADMVEAVLDWDITPEYNAELVDSVLAMEADADAAPTHESSVDAEPMAHSAGTDAEPVLAVDTREDTAAIADVAPDAPAVTNTDEGVKATPEAVTPSQRATNGRARRNKKKKGFVSRTFNFFGRVLEGTVYTAQAALILGGIMVAADISQNKGEQIVNPALRLMENYIDPKAEGAVSVESKIYTLDEVKFETLNRAIATFAEAGQRDTALTALGLPNISEAAAYHTNLERMEEARIRALSGLAGTEINNPALATELAKLADTVAEAKADSDAQLETVIEGQTKILGPVEEPMTETQATVIAKALAFSRSQTAFAEGNQVMLEEAEIGVAQQIFKLGTALIDTLKQPRLGREVLEVAKERGSEEAAARLTAIDAAEARLAAARKAEFVNRGEVATCTVTFGSRAQPVCVVHVPNIVKTNYIAFNIAANGRVTQRRAIFDSAQGETRIFLDMMLQERVWLPQRTPQ
ncbi:MAG: hypothetical protein KGQ41_02615 [Alphaproteobacteria bacterium]|nr:hypothetical protein [Alphaproteobacteria bacterium]